MINTNAKNRIKEKNEKYKIRKQLCKQSKSKKGKKVVIESKGDVQSNQSSSVCCDCYIII